MSNYDLQVLKERIMERYDPDYVVDVLGISTEDLLEAFEGKLVEKVDDFAELLDGEDE